MKCNVIQSLDIPGTLPFPQHIFWDMEITLFSKTMVPHATDLTLSSMQWKSDQNMRCLEWPPHSPDLNPIENLWKDL